MADRVAEPESAFGELTAELNRAYRAWFESANTWTRAELFAGSKAPEGLNHARWWNRKWALDVRARIEVESTRMSEEEAEVVAVMLHEYDRIQRDWMRAEYWVVRRARSRRRLRMPPHRRLRRGSRRPRGRSRIRSRARSPGRPRPRPRPRCSRRGAR